VGVRGNTATRAGLVDVEGAGSGLPPWRRRKRTQGRSVDLSLSINRVHSHTEEGGVEPRLQQASVDNETVPGQANGWLQGSS
jgi:hypothetical protein